MSSDLGRLGLKEAIEEGASYADIRIGEILDENLTVKNGVPDETNLLHTKGFGIRAMIKGAWGFAASVDVTRKEVIETSREAVAIANASAKLRKKSGSLKKRLVRRDKYSTAMKKDPADVPLEDKMEVLMDAERTLARHSPFIKVSYAFFRAMLEKKLFMSTDGDEISQQINWCGGGIAAVAIKNGEVQRRSYPSSFRGNFATSGYEFFESLDLPQHARQTAEEAVNLLSAEKCPSGTKDLILTGDQLALQIHESCGHPTELDRALGMEADYAGTSFLTTDKLGKFRYGSKNVSIVADATVPKGLGTFGYDDEGTPAKKVYLVRDGMFVGYQSSRETATLLRQDESSGGMRADSPLALPLIRMTNINLLPGKWMAEEVVENTKDGILMETNRSWSIDDRRLNFQFGTEIGWTIKRGSKEKLVRNPTYTGSTPDFWGSCDAVSKDDWKMWGTPNCGKGVPGQVMYVGHGCGTARFKKVKVGLIK
ncbi:MAG: TldD/PmbA family protein [Candidatus Bathyarchaeota archaeon]|jgi:TldD protein|nr:MAG: TldD/PmbA family protein [Candidatus Bathyarchaeota archaeon]